MRLSINQFDVRLARVARKRELSERTKSTLLPHQCQGLYPQMFVSTDISDNFLDFQFLDFQYVNARPVVL